MLSLYWGDSDSGCRLTGRTNGPLADSMLSYSLRGLHPSAAFTSEAMRELEETLDFEHMENFMEETARAILNPY